MTAGGPPPLRVRILRRLPPNMWAIIVLAVGGLVSYLIFDHWPHVLAALPYVAILALAGWHLFGHGGHGGAGGHGSHGNSAGHGGHGNSAGSGSHGSSGGQHPPTTPVDGSGPTR